MSAYDLVVRRRRLLRWDWQILAQDESGRFDVAGGENRTERAATAAAHRWMRAHFNQN